jgi:hypothetical protein
METNQAVETCMEVTPELVVTFDEIGEYDKAILHAVVKFKTFNIRELAEKTGTDDETGMYYGLKRLKSKNFLTGDLYTLCDTNQPYPYSERDWFRGYTGLNEEAILRFAKTRTFGNGSGIYSLVEAMMAAGDDLPPRPIILEYLIVESADTFMTRAIPPREVLLETIDLKSPILYAQSLNQIFAWRGTGKTNIALGIAKALATGGSFLRWKATRPVKVLYAEGELPASQMQERLRSIVGPTNGNLRLITLDSQPNHQIPSLGTEKGQAELESVIGDAEVVFLDSISTLFNIATNDEENWLQIQNWLKRLRSKGVTIVFLHHSGKSGLQRGSSKSEDLLDISIKLSRPSDYKTSDGLAAVIEFDKVRGCALLDGEPLLVKMAIKDGLAEWTFASVDDADQMRANELFDGGATVRDVKDDLGCSIGKASYLRKAWTDQSKSPKDLPF